MIAVIMAVPLLLTQARPGAHETPQPSGTPISGLAEDMARDAVGEGHDRQIVLTETQLNRQLHQHLQEHPDLLPIREPQVRLRGGGRLDVRGITQVAGREAEIQAVVRLEARQGRLDLEIESARAGSIPVPPAVAQEIAERAVQLAGLSGLRGNTLPEGIESLAVEEGRMIITRR